MTAPGAAVVVVPGRRDSTRLPRKLLLAESGQPLYAHTLRRCLGASVPGRVLAAVDGAELAAVAATAGAEVAVTDPALPSGTDRVWAAAQRVPEAQWIVNVQGDEPEVEPAAIDAVFGALAAGAEVATLCAPFPPGVDPHNPAAVKVVLDHAGRGLYFSRAAIPYPRNPDARGPWLHIGVYGYTRAALQHFAAWSPSHLERVEGLEQLRFLEHGVTIQVVPWTSAFRGIDTREDYDAFLQRIAQRP